MDDKKSIGHGEVIAWINQYGPAAWATIQTIIKLFPAAAPGTGPTPPPFPTGPVAPPVSTKAALLALGCPECHADALEAKAARLGLDWSAVGHWLTSPEAVAFLQQILALATKIPVA